MHACHTSQLSLRTIFKENISAYMHTYISRMAAANSSRSSLLFVCFLLAAAYVLPTTYGQMSPDFYRRACPPAMPQIRNILRRALQRDPRMGASLLRLHFHDCFVNVSI